MKKILYIIGLLTFLSCEKEKELQIDQELLAYFQLFADEGAKRGVTIDYGVLELEGYIQSLEEEALKGRCVHDNVDPDRVIIDKEFWDNNDAFSREFLVFHELGHCALDRNHRDDLGGRRLCVSIMHSGDLKCRENYTEKTRDTYLDELFTQ